VWELGTRRRRLLRVILGIGRPFFFLGGDIKYFR
jgi:hypothetical protein